MRTELSAGFAADGYARAGGAAGRAADDDRARLVRRDLRADGGADELRPARQHRLAGAARRDRAANRGFLHELPTQSHVLASLREVARGRARHRRACPT